MTTEQDRTPLIESKDNINNQQTLTTPYEQ